MSNFNSVADFLLSAILGQRGFFLCCTNWTMNKLSIAPGQTTPQKNNFILEILVFVMNSMSFAKFFNP